MKLTPDERAALEGIWSEVAKDLQGNSVAVFLMFFAAYPDCQNKYKKFCSTPLEELPNNEIFRAHTVKAVSALDFAIANLDDTATISDALIDLGTLHGKRFGVTLNEFVAFIRILAELLATALPHLWTETAKSAWGKI
ncbi:globin CTT-VIIB-5/CTT-VIIB-9-like isoform X2 [Folsomia candida]|nr:globin CTT-VIIB-5/CTT-VIIB-9-like isoform X2 [Folsomia candida]